MDKLELKDLAPYYAYELLFMSKYKTIHKLGIHNEMRGKGIESRTIDQCLEMKPLLRPMSDLTKEITHNGETFIPIVRLLRMKFPDEPLIGRYSIIKVSKSGYPRAYFEFMATKDIRIYPFELFDAPYWIIQKLQEWHFDTEKLIERGLAINLNEVDNGK